MFVYSLVVIRQRLKKNIEALISLVHLVNSVNNIVAYLAIIDPVFEDTALSINSTAPEDVLTPACAHVLIPEIARVAPVVEATDQAGLLTAAVNVSAPESAAGDPEIEDPVPSQTSKRAKKRFNQKKNRLERN